MFYRRIFKAGAGLTAASSIAEYLIMKPKGDDNSMDSHKYFLQAEKSSIQCNQKHSQIPNFKLLIHAHCKSRDSKHNFDFIADAAEMALPSVVSIAAYHKYPMSIRAESSGTGFIVDEKGYIITNEHVVEGTVNVALTFHNGETVPGRVVAVDDKTDLALIKVDAPFKLKELTMAEDKDLRVGQWVIAIGNSLCYSNSVTVGVVSFLERELYPDTQFPIRKQRGKLESTKYVQTDAAINRGNSGGPLVNLEGEVVAVNSLSLHGEVQNMNFSIPISDVKRFLKEFSEGKSHDHPKSRYALGIRAVTLNQGMVGFLKSQNRIPDDIDGGVFVYGVVSGSPAQEIALKRGDIILKVDGQAVDSTDAMAKILNSKGGESVIVEFYRPKVGLFSRQVVPKKV